MTSAVSEASRLAILNALHGSPQGLTTLDLERATGRHYETIRFVLANSPECFRIGLAKVPDRRRAATLWGSKAPGPRLAVFFPKVKAKATPKVKAKATPPPPLPATVPLPRKGPHTVIRGPWPYEVRA